MDKENLAGNQLIQVPGFPLFYWQNKKLSYCWKTVRHESMPKIAEMDVEMTT